MMEFVNKFYHVCLLQIGRCSTQMNQAIDHEYCPTHQGIYAFKYRIHIPLNDITIKATVQVVIQDIAWQYKEEHLKSLQLQEVCRIRELEQVEVVILSQMLILKVDMKAFKASLKISTKMTRVKIIDLIVNVKLTLSQTVMMEEESKRFEIINCQPFQRNQTAGFGQRSFLGEGAIAAGGSESNYLFQLMRKSGFLKPYLKRDTAILPIQQNERWTIQRQSQIS